MKRLCNLVLSMIMAAAVIFLFLCRDARAAAFQPGDVDTDGTVGIKDVTLVLAHVRQENRLTGEDAFKRADANGDRKINIGDVSTIYSCAIHVPKPINKPSFGWIDDDGKGKVSYLYEWAQNNRVPFTCAVITGKIDVDKRWLTSQAMQEMYSSGLVRFASHTQNHTKLSQVDPDVVDAELSTSKAQIEGFGVPCDFIVYPFGAINDSDLNLVSRYFPYGFAAGGPYRSDGIPKGDRVNTPGSGIYKIKRVDISGKCTEENGGLDYLKQQIDQAIDRGGMLIFMSHVGSTSDGQGGYLDPQKDLEVYSWALHYIRERGYDIEPVIDVCNKFAGK